MRYRTDISKEGFCESLNILLGLLRSEKDFSMKHICALTDIPWRTMQDWHLGKSAPISYNQNAILAKINALL